jgi:hypothetical protein
VKMATPEQMRAFLSQHVDSDLHFLFEDAGLSLDTQYAIAQNYKTVKHFSALADDRAEIRKFCKDDIALDASAGARERAEVATVVTAWEAARECVTQDNKIKAEARALGISRPLPQTDRAAMKKALEQAQGKKNDRELPSTEYLAHKIEEIELNEMQASALDEITSMEESTTTSLQSSIDNDGKIRVVRTKAKGTMPQNTEQLRAKYKIESNAWMMLAAKFRQKAWLSDFDPGVFDKLVEYLLGPKVYLMSVPRTDGTDGLVPLHPSWSIILRYEHELRKAAFKLVKEESDTLAIAMSKVVKDSELKEIYFTSPIALSSRKQKTDTALEEPANKKNKTNDSRSSNEWRPPKGSGKNRNKAKGGGKGGGKGKSRLASVTADGRQICYKFNNNQSCDGGCGRVHVCQIRGCLGPHSKLDHFKTASK